MQLGNVLCTLCRKVMENAQHLFSTCRIASRVYDLCERWIGSVTIRHESILINFQNFYLMRYKTGVNRAWKRIWVTIVTDLKL